MRRDTYTKLSILVPVFNEEKTICRVLNNIVNVKLKGALTKEIIIVDDCSTDATLSEINRFLQEHDGENIMCYQHKSNQGKGAALHTAISKCKGDLIVIQDADLEYDPEEYNLLLDPILAGHADVVYGSRFIGGLPHRALFFWHTLGNKFLTFISNIFTNLNLTDIETCFKMFKKEILDQVSLTEKRFGFEPEITAKISRISNIRIYEVGISYYGRNFDEGKKIGWRDGFRALYVIIKYNVFAK